MHRPRAASALLLAAAGLAQATPCLSANDQSNSSNPNITGIGLAGATSWGFQLSPTTPLLVRSGRLYTGNTTLPRGMNLEIWTDDNTTNLPGMRLTGGNWQCSTAVRKDWVGTNFDTPLPLVPGVRYWLVWIEPGGSEIPYDPLGTTGFPVARKLGAGAWGALGSEALKVRLYCSLLDAPGVTVRGDGCGGGSGIGSAFTNDEPLAGNGAFRVEATSFPPGAPAVLVLGVDPRFPSLPLVGGPPGCFLHVDPVVVVAGQTGTGDARSTSGYAGHAQFPLPIPGAGVVGRYLGAQVGVLDRSFSVPLPFVTSNGLGLVFR